LKYSLHEQLVRLWPLNSRKMNRNWPRVSVSVGHYSTNLCGYQMRPHRALMAGGVFQPFGSSSARRAKPVKASEKEQLRILCLKMKAEREQHELDVSRGKIEEEITPKFFATFDRAQAVLATALRQMLRQLAPVFEGMKAMSTYQTLERAHLRGSSRLCLSYQKSIRSTYSGEG